MPAYARSTARLCQALVAAVVVSGRAASEVVRAHRVFWWLVASMLTAAADLLTDPDDVLVRRLGVDEHRYRSVPLRLALHRAGRSDEALPHARAAVRINSPYAPFYYHLGVVEAAVGNTTEARAALRRALSLNPEFSRRHAAEARRLLLSLE